MPVASEIHQGSDGIAADRLNNNSPPASASRGPVAPVALPGSSAALHQRGIQPGRNPRGAGLHIARQTTRRRRRGRRAPQVIRGIRQERGTAVLGEDAAVAAVAFRQDDLVEELDGRVLGAGGLAVVDELIEALRVGVACACIPSHHGYAAQELVHVEVIDETGFAAVARSRVQVAAVGVEEGGEAADKGSADLVGLEGDWADETDGWNAAWVDSEMAACRKFVSHGPRL